ncbi:MAG: helix-turn-helix domain-containing protein [Bacilli bacterium]|jgi:putative transcriptional regulator|nr:helix-turn-helix domain-containing protein [Bacilli bacterium]
MDYGKALRALREKLLITQTELAQKLGVSYASVNRWENKKCEPTMKAKRKIVELCKKNDVSLNGGNNL